MALALIQLQHGMPMLLQQFGLRDGKFTTAADPSGKMLQVVKSFSGFEAHDVLVSVGCTFAGKYVQPVITSYSIHYTKLYERYHFAANGAEASGYPVGPRHKPGFMVLQGSSVNTALAGSLRPAVVELCTQLQAKGVLVSEGARLRFVADQVFHSPSLAASLIAGNNRSGLDVITSYSIHYTKLYECHVQQNEGSSFMARLVPRLAAPSFTA